MISLLYLLAFLPVVFEYYHYVIDNHSGHVVYRMMHIFDTLSKAQTYFRLSIYCELFWLTLGRTLANLCGVCSQEIVVASVSKI